jgi:hypothetical protein
VLQVAPETNRPMRVSLGTAGSQSAVDIPFGPSVAVEREIVHAGGPLSFDASLWGAPQTSVWIDRARISSALDTGALVR